MIHDFVMLGKTVPEPNSKKLIYVCSAGVSPSSGGLLRLYPLSVLDCPRKWQQCRIDLSGKRSDNRRETRTLGPAGYVETGLIGKADRAALLAPYVVGSIAEANERRMSLALIRPRSWEFHLDCNPGERAPHREIFGPVPPKARERFDFTPRLHFTDSVGTHRLQVREWGLFELMRKHETKIAAMTQDQQASWIFGSLSMTERSLLFVGNFAQFRNSWLIISVLNGVAL